MRGERVLVTGATGYIGGRLAPRLLTAGYRVRCLVRDPRRLEGRPWRDRVDVVAGDVLQPETLPAAMQDVTIAYYLIHSMAGGADFEARDLAAARNFGRAAADARRRAHRLPGRAGRSVNEPFAAPALAAGHGRCAARGGCARDGVPRRGHRRIRQPLV